MKQQKLLVFKGLELREDCNKMGCIMNVNQNENEKLREIINFLDIECPNEYFIHRFKHYIKSKCKEV